MGGALGGSRFVAENQAYVIVTKAGTATEGGSDEVLWELMNVTNSTCRLQPTPKMRTPGLQTSELQALAKQITTLANRRFAAFATQTVRNSRPPEEDKRKPHPRELFSPPAGNFFNDCSSNDCVSLLQVICDVHADLPCSKCNRTFATTTGRDAHEKKCKTDDDKSLEEPDKKPRRFSASCRM